ncbi:MAG: hypothetical protein ACRKGH_01695 [Dehalogenimonas sp.]
MKKWLILAAVFVVILAGGVGCDSAKGDVASAAAVEAEIQRVIDQTNAAIAERDAEILVLKTTIDLNANTLNDLIQAFNELSADSKDADASLKAAILLLAGEIEALK